MQVTHQDWQESELVQSQIDVADIIILNKLDVASEADLSSARAFASKAFPPKLQVLECSGGNVQVDILRCGRDAAHIAAHTLNHSGEDLPDRLDLGSESSALQMARPNESGAERAGGDGSTATLSTMQPRAPLKFLAADVASHSSCGWLFHEDDIFDRSLLKPLMDLISKNSHRVKGVFRVGKEYIVLKAGSAGVINLGPFSYRRESRIEIIALPGRSASTSGGEAVTEAATPPAPDGSALNDALAGLGGSTEIAAAVMRCDWTTIENALLAVLKSAPT